MPSKYRKATLARDGAAIYDAVVASTPLLQNAGLPVAGTAGVRSLDIGDFFYTHVELANPFIHSLLNRIALEVVMSKNFQDPWGMLEKGKIDTGEVIEEVYIAMAKPKHFDQERAEREVFKREFPDVLTAFHAINYQFYYKITVSREQLRGAFLSWDRFHRFVSDLISQMYNGAAYDTYQTKKYLIARAMLNGALGTETVTPITDEKTGRDALAVARGVSSLMTLMSPNYNLYHVQNYAPYSDQVLIIDARAEAQMDTTTLSVLANAFDKSLADFLRENRLITSGFGDLDNDRLNLLFANDKSYKPITDAEKERLNQIPFAIFDRNWFQIYDYTNVVESINNPEGLYINYDYHVWKIFGVSPFSNAMAFTSTPQAVLSVEISPTAVTISKGQSAQLGVTVTTDGFADMAVIWSSDSDDVTVTQAGKVTVSADATATTATITATSRYDSSKSATATITIA